MTDLFFPEDAFRKETRLQRLSHIFNSRSYGLPDLNLIKSAQYYSDIHLKGTSYCYTAACVVAERQPDGKFTIETHRSQQEDGVVSPARVYGEPEITRDPRAYGDNEILAALDTAIAPLAATAQHSSEEGLHPPFFLAGYVPIELARDIQAAPRTRKYIAKEIEKREFPEFLMD